MQHFTDAQGKNYLPGDVIDLPQSYLGEKWLESVEAERKVIVPPAKVEPVVSFLSGVFTVSVLESGISLDEGSGVAHFPQ